MEGQDLLEMSLRCRFNNKRDFLRWTTSTIAPEDKEKLIIIHTNLGAILRVINISHKLKIVKF